MKNKRLHIKNLIFVLVILIFIISTMFSIFASSVKSDTPESLIYQSSNFNKNVISSEEELNTQIEILKEQLNDSKIKLEEKDKKISELQENTNQINDLKLHIEDLAERNAEFENQINNIFFYGTKPLNYNVSEIISRGSYHTSRDKLEYIGESIITFYNPTKEQCGNNKGITASGQPVIAGVTVAIDTNYWQLGTKFYIEGFGEVIGVDTGSAIKGKNRFDLCIFDENIANYLGKVERKVWVLKN